MSTELVIGLLGVGGLSAIIAAIITGIFSKRKLGAEATEIITKAAAGVVTNMQADLDRQRERNEEMAAQHARDMAEVMADHRREKEDWIRVLQLHVAWDALVVAKLGEHGEKMPDPPPLLPPNLNHGRL